MTKSPAIEAFVALPEDEWERHCNAASDPETGRPYCPPHKIKSDLRKAIRVVRALRRDLAATKELAARDETHVVVNDISIERQRQKDVEGWTSKHDDRHENSEMAMAAATYILHGMGSNAPWHRPTIWPWDWSWWKPKDRRRDLVRAAALIVAEIERLDRKSTGAAP